MLTSVLLPLAILGAVAWVLPLLLARFLPRRMSALVLNGAISAVLLFAAAALLFAFLYGPAAGEVWQTAPAHFLILAARSAFLWGPILVLSLANQPRRWSPEDWALPGAGDRDMRDGGR